MRGEVAGNHEGYARHFAPTVCSGLSLPQDDFSFQGLALKTPSLLWEARHRGCRSTSHTEEGQI